ncbi:MAG TPA: hypothetical protein PLE45_01525 [Spirochaetota bacterium]|nr:hypothetical protein [Spirochaetota bacterium]HOL56642.1 hypothetical protein [Spirochaetota bacterium]HPP03732.1 hypothetical protein [Spirochaetota bacterium]
MKKNIIFLITIIILILIIGCSEGALNQAYLKATFDNTENNLEVSNILLIQQTDSYNISINWKNPDDSNYKETIILKSSKTFPLNTNDSNSTKIYQGNATSYIDSDVSPDRIYYYRILTKNKYNKYSTGITSSIEVFNISEIYDQNVTNFTLSQISNTTNVQLNWINPTDDKFIGVYVYRKTTGYPTGINDPQATLVYQGTSDNTIDTGLLANNVYYYTIFCKSDDNKISAGTRNAIGIVNFTPAPNVYYQKVSNFRSTLGNGNVLLEWDNPVDASFDGVRIKRKIGSYPSAYNDGSATTIYEGTSDSYLDNSVVNGNTYYYAIFVKNDLGYFSNTSAKSYKKVLTFTQDIRRRCFYLIGGSSSYTEPFSNLVTEVDAFDPVTETIYANVTQLPTPRYGCDIASANGKIYVFGGVDENKNIVSRVDVLDVSSPVWPDNIWSEASPMPLPRFSHRALSSNGKIYVLGGATGYLGINEGPTYLIYSYIYMSAKIHLYDPTTDNWIVDEVLVPNMQSVAGVKRMNFAAGVFDGNLLYSAGVYNGTANLTNTTILQNMTSNYYITLSSLAANSAEGAGLFYNKKKADNTELYLFLYLGGTTTNPTYYEPIRAGTPPVVGTNLTAVNSCYYIMFEYSGGVNASNWTALGSPAKNLLTPRAYAKAEYYGDYVYIFCGINNVGAVINSIEKIQVDDSASFPSGWQSVSSTGLTNRYGFGLTKVK